MSLEVGESNSKCKSKRSTCCKFLLSLFLLLAHLSFRPFDDFSYFTSRCNLRDEMRYVFYVTLRLARITDDCPNLYAAYGGRRNTWPVEMKLYDK